MENYAFNQKSNCRSNGFTSQPIVWSIMTVMAFMLTVGIYGQDMPQAIGGELTPDIAWHTENNALYLSGKGVVPTTMLGARSAWNNSRSLFQSVVVEDGITGIGQNVFTGYKNITSVTIAASVKDIAPNAFNTCKNLSVVEVRGAIPPDINKTVFFGVKTKKMKLIVPAGTKSTYTADPFWGKFGTIVESIQPAEVQPDLSEKLAEPFIIRLKRTSNFVGGGRKVSVFLNGVKQQDLGNAKTIEIQTELVKNELYISQGKTAIAIRRFDATAGGDIYIEFSYMFGNMKIMDEKNDE